MAGSDSQKPLLTLIREFASERSQKDRSLAGLRKKIDELRKECEAANAVLENLKRTKETVEQEVKGKEVELAMANAAIQSVEKRIAKFEDEISTVGSSIDELKKMEESLRDEFIKEMMVKNAKIRKLQKIRSSVSQMKDTEPKQPIVEENEFDSITIKNKLAEIASQMSKEKEQFQAEQSIYEQIQQEMIDVEKKLSLIEDVTKTSKELEELAKLCLHLTTNKRTAEVEEECASLGEELQRRSECPSCHADNLEAIQGFIQ